MKPSDLTSIKPINSIEPGSIPVLVLFGPTASGKTDILMKLCFSRSGSAADAAHASPIEVVSADSMQVYRGMDIGTAKPTPEERVVLPHHLIDICDPSEQFNAGDFVRLAEEACLDIAGRGKLPVVSGGTGFYLKSLIMGLSEAPPGDLVVRAQLKEELHKKGALFLMEELAAADPVSAGRIHINDEYRLLRALEVWRCSGKPLSSFKAPVLSSVPEKTEPCGCHSASELKNPSSEETPQKRPFSFTIIGLSRPREELYRRINERCAQMFKQGLHAEVRALYEKGYTPDDPGMRAIGYREFFVEEAGEGSVPRWRLSEDLEGVRALVAQNSRRYAKRQITFFKGIPNVNWINLTAESGCPSDNLEFHEELKKILKNKPLCNSVYSVV